MQTIGQAPTVHHATGKFVNQNNLAVFDDVVLVAQEQLVRPQRLIDVVDQ